MNWDEIVKPLEELKDCSICPRDCHADRAGDRLGYCQSGIGFSISSIFAHMGEEPVLSGEHGICNVFFTHCNLQCIYCQNYQISRNRDFVRESLFNLVDIICEIEAILDSGARAVGFVSPSHFIPQMKTIINALTQRGRRPVYVFNTNAYDRVETIKSLEKTINVYLPDLKYMDAALARRYSDAPRYPEIATAAIKEMFRQKGADIKLAADGTIDEGLIIRHLVLPGEIENSKAVLRFIAEELSPDIHISLMSQYHPTPHVADHPKLNQVLTVGEYEEVLDEFDRLGFHRGWVQQMDSPFHYQPDFDNKRPFSE
ncbi:MAG: radical SAM protein [candidate division Zixibacteria bacterium]|nr:radical SAM protein [candidate division Zixibacteria bacterium]